MDTLKEKINWLEIMSEAVRNTFKAELIWIINIIDLFIKQSKDFYQIVDKISEIKWKVIVIWMWKSWLVGNKISATLSSTWTPTFSVHPWEAIHWDLWMISKNDIVLMISNSWNTQEIVDIIPVIKKYFWVKIVWITSNKKSIIKKQEYHHLV